MESVNNNLTKKEIVYFYNLLYEYEHRPSSKYDNKKVKKAMEGKIVINDSFPKNANITEMNLNVLNFTPYSNSMCLGILYHIRNSFAHGNLTSVDDGKAFLIKDFSDKQKRSKCNMLGYIAKEKLYELIDTIRKTSKNTKRK